MKIKLRQRGFSRLVVILSLAWLASACQSEAPDEECEVAGDENDSGLADCNDPACSGAPSCQTRCGNGRLEAGEGCDDGNTGNHDVCTNACEPARCGDGFVQPGVEQCDAGNTANTPGCHRDCTVDVLAYVKASNTGGGDFFGEAVALSADGSTLAVGAFHEGSAATGIGGDQTNNSVLQAGAVYVFARNGTTWTQQAYLKASNTSDSDSFGWSIALSADGSTLAVSAWGERSAATGIGGDQTDNSAIQAGAVYVFTRSGTTWTQQAYVKASNASTADLFGWSVALSADGATLAVGAWGEDSAATGINGDQTDNSAEGAGAVYVFARTGTTWTQQAYVKAYNPGNFDHFGWSVALAADGATLAVGARDEDSAATGIDGNQADDSAPYAGAVYLFARSGTTWRQQAYVKASRISADDNFGIRVALSADGATLAVGAIGEDSAATGTNGDQTDDSTQDAGAVYVFTRSDATWRQQAYVKASNTGAVDRFGWSVALSADGSTLAVSAGNEDSAATGIGGNQADNSAQDAGAVYVFTRSGTAWSQPAYVKAFNTGAGDSFGSSVALSVDGSTLAVGALGEGSAATGINGDQADNSALQAGAVYVYQ
jgi:cysteine-rich repeat protein